MGAFASSVPAPIPIPIPDNVRELVDAGVCGPCISRILTISRQEITAFSLPKPSCCAACSNVIDSVDEIKSAARDAISCYCFRDLQIEMPNELSVKDDHFIEMVHARTSCSLKNFLKSHIEICLGKARAGPTLHVRIKDATSFTCDLEWPCLYISGRYFKRSRRVSHARFMAGGSISSVEAELLSGLSGIVECSEMKFQSAGREDIDVRMIGTGRPFCLTLVNTKPSGKLPCPITNDAFAASFADKVPESIECGFGVSAREIMISWQMPNVEPGHAKGYRCVVYCECPVTDEMFSRIEAIDELVILQRTPCRVAHRREMMDREKMIIKAECRRVCEKVFVLDLRTSGGTYIKEFVNSDFGRTCPSLAEIMNPGTPMDCQLLQLDVVSVGE